ncbi:MAG: trigger factor [Lachnospiraceae bacterium]|nr:trigger factor [Lachnospiraceae bacterium]
MSVKIEKKEHNMAMLTIEVDLNKFDKACQQAYLRTRGRINVPGFRKGKAPRKMIEKIYGAEIFFEDAVNLLIPDAYEEALGQIDETVVSQPAIDVVQVEAGKPVIFTAEVALKPQVELGQYKGIEVEPIHVEVTEDEINARIDRERENNSRMIDIDDRPVENGDLIRLDYEGTISGEPFDGGKGTDYPLTIGSNSFIPGFEEQLIGSKIGEDRDIVVTFPDDYHAEELRGKVAVFACKVNSIQKKELPEADDEFAQDVSEFDTLAEFKEDIRKNILESKENEAKRQREAVIVDKIIENAQMDIPEAMIREQVDRMKESFTRQIQSQFQGITVEQYMQLTGMDAQKLDEQMRPEALKRIQNSLVLEAIADAENIEISDERLDEEFQKMADSYRMEKDKLVKMMGEEEKKQMKEDLRIQAAVDLIRDSAKETA